MGAMSAYAISYHTGSAWLGVARGRIGRAGAGSDPRWLAQQRRVNDISVGIAVMIFGGGLANYLGKPFIQPIAPQLPTLRLGAWSELPPGAVSIDG